MRLGLTKSELGRTGSVRNWSHGSEHVLDGASPTLGLDVLRQRAALYGAPVPMATLAPRTGGVKYVVNSVGALVAVGANEIAIDWSNGVPEMLLEGQATNYLVYSNPAQWAKAAVDYIAYKLVEDSSLNIHRIYANTVGATTGGTIWVDARAGERRYLYVNAVTLAGCGAVFDLLGGTVTHTVGGTPSITANPDGSYRCAITGSGGSGGATTVFLQVQTLGNTIDESYAGDGASGLYIYRVQYEANSVPSSYIPTSGSPVVRSADLCPLHAAASACTAWAFQANVPVLIADQRLLTFQSASLLRASNATPSSLVVDGVAPAAIFATSALPGNIGSCYGWGTSGVRASNLGSSVYEAAKLAATITQMYIGAPTGLAAYQIIRMRGLKGYTLSDRPSAAGVLAQARLAT